MVDTVTLTLYELNALVRGVIEQELYQEYWVEAELSEARQVKGHCYMELIQKAEGSNTPVARASAKCWRSSWAMIQPHFERVTGQTLHAGLKVRLKVYAQFHEAFGFSWIVTDIDPNFTLGDMARKRQEIIAQLKREGVFDMQRELELPLFCQRIAVISSASAAGYGDFCNQLEQSGFVFHTELFPAIMQGEQVEQSVIAALNLIYNRVDDFDCVVIIRGGGATADMSGFDTLALAENVAQFPLPIITGIGHERDESILDMVSHTRVKTPTAAAAFLIDRLERILERINDCEERITHYAQRLIENYRLRLNSIAERIPTLFALVRTKSEARLDQLAATMGNILQNRMEREQTRITNLNTQLSVLFAQRLLKEQHRLELLEQRTQSLDPQLLLKRGYSITLLNGKTVRNAKQLKSGDEIETRVAEGIIKSVVR